MEHAAVLRHIQKSSYVKELRKIFTILNNTLKLTRFCIFFINQTKHVTHTLEIKRQQQKRCKKSDS